MQAFGGQVEARDQSIMLESVGDGKLSGNGGGNVYETDNSLHMYLGLHYPSSGEEENVSPVLPHANAPIHGVGFPQRVVQLLMSLKPERSR
jgi:hypothetical protein